MTISNEAELNVKDFQHMALQQDLIQKIQMERVEKIIFKRQTITQLGQTLK